MTIQNQNETGPSLRPWILPVALALIPFSAVIWAIVRYGYAFPFWDEWHFLPFVQNIFEGHVRLAELWVQHNEHRPLFPRIIMLVLARFTGWDVRYNLGVNVALGLAWFSAVVWLAKSTAARLNRPFSPWLFPAFSFVVFSLAQMENWVWGWQLLVFLNTFAVVAGVAMLASGTFTWWRFAGAVLMGVVAVYSMASGLIYWFAVFPALIAAPGHTRKTRIFSIELWAVAAFLVIESYFFLYKTPSVSPSLGAMFQTPVAFVGFVILYLGGPMTGLIAAPAWHGVMWPVTPIQFLPGLAGIAAFLGLAYNLSIRKKTEFGILAPWYALALHAGAAAGVTAAGRVGSGLGGALMSQYMTTGALFWCALIGLAAVHLETQTRQAKRRRLPQSVVMVAAVLVVIGGQFLFIHMNRNWQDVCRWKQMGWDAIRSGIEEPLYLEDICYDGQALQKDFLPTLKKYRLCGFGSPPPLDARSAQAYVDEAKRFIATNRLMPAATYLKTAMHLDPSRQDIPVLLQQVSEKTRAVPSNQSK